MARILKIPKVIALLFTEMSVLLGKGIKQKRTNAVHMPEISA